MHILDASHLFIGIAAFALTAETYLASGQNINYPLCLIIGCAGVVFYGVHRIFQLRRYGARASFRMGMLSYYRHVTLSCIIIALVCFLLLIFNYFNSEWWIWVLLGLFSLIYLVPVIKNRIRLRDLPYLKIWAISFTWPLITVALPALYDLTFDDQLMYMYGERFLFFLLITLPFDVRDRYEDELLGVKTFASRFNKSYLIFFGIVLFISISLTIWLAPFATVYAVSLQTMALLALLLLFLSNEKRPLWYFSFVVDGLMPLRIIIFCLLAWIF